MMKLALWGAVFAAGLFVSSWSDVRADDYQKGASSFEQGDLATALSYWLPLAEQDHVQAQYGLGKLYETGGEDAPPDYQQAVQWYEKAAAQGMAAALNNLGRLYAQGRGVEQDLGKAVGYWTQASKKSHPMAQYNLGLAYFRGEGVTQNIAQAVFWFHQSAKGGVAGAKYALGEVYRLGLTVPVDLRQAETWYEAAAEAGDPRATVALSALRQELARQEAAARELAAAEKAAEAEAELAAEAERKERVAAESLEETVAEESDTTAVETEGAGGDAAKADGSEQQSGADAEAKVVMVTFPELPVRNPRRYAGTGSEVVKKPKRNPKR